MKENSLFYIKIIFWASSILFLAGLFTSPFIFKIKPDSLAVFIAISTFVMAITIMITGIILFIHRKKKAKTNFERFIVFWLWYHVLGIISLFFVFIYIQISGKNILFERWKDILPNIPSFFVSTINIFQILLSILIVYGIKKRNLIGWYASLFDATLVSAMNIVFTLADKSLFMVILTVIYAFFGFYIFKNRDYFSTPIKGREGGGIGWRLD